MNHITQNSVEEQELLVRGERNNRMIQRLSEKLSSYTYEPKCPQRFEKFYELNKSIQNYKDLQKRVMSKIRQRKLDLKNGQKTPFTIIQKIGERFCILFVRFG